MPSCDRCNHMHKIRVVCPCTCHDDGICKCNTISGNCMIHKRGAVYLQDTGKFK